MSKEYAVELQKITKVFNNGFIPATMEQKMQ